MMQATYRLSPTLMVRFDYSGEQRNGRPFVRCKLLPERRPLTRDEMRVLRTCMREVTEDVNEQLSKVAP
jgi:hypothetical protein